MEGNILHTRTPGTVGVIFDSGVCGGKEFFIRGAFSLIHKEGGGVYLIEDRQTVERLIERDGVNLAGWGMPISSSAHVIVFRDNAMAYCMKLSWN